MVATAAAMLCMGAGAGAAQTRLVSRFGDWTFYAHDSPQTKLCFALTAPRLSEPAGARRDPVFLYLSAWPKDGVKTELSVKIGYAFRRGSDATAIVGSGAFRLFTSNDRAFVGDPAEEIKLIEAMKKSTTLIVQGTSERGTATKDTFSLAGLGQALTALSNGCP